MCWWSYAQALLSVSKLLLLSALASSALWAQACVLVTFALNGTPYPSGCLGPILIRNCGVLWVLGCWESSCFGPPFIRCRHIMSGIMTKPKKKTPPPCIIAQKRVGDHFPSFFFLFLIRLGVQHPLVPARPHRQDKKKHLMRSTRLVKGVARETNNKLLMYFPWKNIPCRLLESCQIKYLVIQ